MRPFVTQVIVLSYFLVTQSVFSKERPELDATMLQLFNALMNLQVMAISSEGFNKPDSKEIVKRDLETLANAKHAFPGKTKTEEPGMMAVLSLFNDYVKETKESFNRGNTEYARHRVKTLGSFCLSCHSRNSSGMDFEDVQNRISRLSLKDFEKAELYGATRQFDKAIATSWLYLEGTPKSELDFIHFTRTLKNYVRLLVRVKQDAVTAKKALEVLSKRKGLPEFDKRLIHDWKKDVEFWVKDPVVPEKMTSDALVRKAEVLIRRAESLQAYPSDDNGEVSYLRASSLLHEVLEREPQPKLRGLALYLLGITYGALKEPYFWDMDTMFFEQCIRENSHTALSRQCYERYVKALYLNQPIFTETYLTDEALKKLGALGALSSEKNGEK